MGIDEKDIILDNVNGEEIDITMEEGQEQDEILKDAEDTKDYSEYTKDLLLDELKSTLQNPIETVRKSVDAIKSNFYRIHRSEKEAFDEAQLESGEESEFVDKAEEEFRAIYKKYRDERVNLLQKEEASREKNLAVKRDIIEKIKSLIHEEESLNKTFQKFKELQDTWHSTGQVPQVNVKDIWELYHHSVEQFYDYVKINKELRDLDFKKNLEIKKDLIEKAKQALEYPSVHDAFSELQGLHNLWRETGPVDREIREQLWEEFKEVSSLINKRHQSFFEQRKEEQEKNLELKKSLCEKAEKLIETKPTALKGWQKQFNELMAVMEEWKQIGFVPKKENAEIYNRFKTSRDTFFQNRREFYKDIKKEYQDNLKLKEQLCEKAEALKDSDEWKKTSDILIQLQKEWKSVGPVPMKISNDIWNRFRGACDAFFNKRSEFYSEKDSKYGENLDLKLALIKEIEEYTLVEELESNLEKINEFKDKWRDIGFVPIKEKESITKKFRKAIDDKFKELNIDDNERKIAQYKFKLDNIENSPKGSLRDEKDKLFYKIRQLENDISLWENNIGFFAKSKNADKMINDVKNNIERAKEEIEVLRQKIDLIDDHN